MVINHENINVMALTIFIGANGIKVRNDILGVLRKNIYLESACLEMETDRVNHYLMHLKFALFFEMIVKQQVYKTTRFDTFTFILHTVCSLFLGIILFFYWLGKRSIKKKGVSVAVLLKCYPE